MSREEVHNPRGTYYQVIDGTFRVNVPENHPDAVMRKWETPDGKSGTKYERIVHALFGKIVKIDFKEGEYGKNVNITLDENEDTKETPIISLAVTSRYGEDFLKKVPGVDLNQDVRLRPFIFTPEGEPDPIRGMEITQRDEEGKFKKKILNFFQSEDKTDKTPLHGLPLPDGDTSTYDSDEWKGYFAKVRKFLIKYAEENVVSKLGAIAPEATEEPQPKTPNYNEGEVNPDDIPF